MHYIRLLHIHYIGNIPLIDQWLQCLLHRQALHWITLPCIGSDCLHAQLWVALDALKCKTKAMPHPTNWPVIATCIAWKIIALDYITLHWIGSLHMHWIALHNIWLHYNAKVLPHPANWPVIAICIALKSIALDYITLHWIGLLHMQNIGFALQNIGSHYNAKALPHPANWPVIATHTLQSTGRCPESKVTAATLHCSWTLHCS